MIARVRQTRASLNYSERRQILGHDRISSRVVREGSVRLCTRGKVKAEKAGGTPLGGVEGLIARSRAA